MSFLSFQNFQYLYLNVYLFLKNQFQKLQKIKNHILKTMKKLQHLIVGNFLTKINNLIRSKFVKFCFNRIIYSLKLSINQGKHSRKSSLYITI